MKAQQDLRQQLKGAGKDAREALREQLRTNREKWLEEHMPDRKDKVLNRIRAIRGGKLNDSDFHTRMRGFGPFAEQLEKMFDIASRKAGIPFKKLELCTANFKVPGSQMGLF